MEAVMSEDPLIRYVAALKAEEESAKAFDAMIVPIVYAGKILEKWRSGIGFTSNAPGKIITTPGVDLLINLDQPLPSLSDVSEAYWAWQKTTRDVDHVKSKVPSDQLRILQQGRSADK